MPDRRIVVFPPHADGAHGSGGSRNGGQFRWFLGQDQQKDDPEPADGSQESRSLDGGSQKDHAAQDAEKTV